MFTNRKKIIILGVLLIVAGLFSYGYFNRYSQWQMAVGAASSFPYQIGLTNAVVINCTTTGVPPLCTGGTYCNTKDAATCTTYADVSGTPAGGSGTGALFSITAMSQAGLSSGGQLIAGGMGPTLMDSGVLASSAGCSGCTARSSRFDKIKNWFNGFIIAGKKD